MEVPHSLLRSKSVDNPAQLASIAQRLITISADFFNRGKKFFVFRNAQHVLGATIYRVHEIGVSNGVSR
jgi:hypothetical protein